VNAGEIRIGTSGWSYQHWGGILYPAGSNSYQQLKYYVKKFDTVEINSSFYHWPRSATFTSWYHRTPPGFLITMKAPRLLTHTKRLYGPENWIQKISADLATLNGSASKLGPLLVQLSPYFSEDFRRLEYFLKQLPGWFQTVVEFRHPSWHHEKIFQLLEHYGVSYCVMSGYNLPCELKATASLVYVRLHGAGYEGNYSEADLAWWAARIQDWQHQGRSIMLYFNNDGNGYAVHNALKLKEMLGM